MDKEYQILLSGPFSIFDSSGQQWEVEAIRIVDESYALIDIYVELASPMSDVPLYEDPVVVRQILSRLRLLGYRGPAFSPGDPGMQDDMLMVLEAPEEFGRFAAAKGWKNLAEEYVNDGEDDSSDVATKAFPRTLFFTLMQRLGVKR